MSRGRKLLDPGTYEVGYKKPPKHARFKPGVSGNPRGRRKGSPSLASLIHDLTRQKVPVSDNGRVRRLPAIEVILRRMLNAAMRDDAKATKTILWLFAQYGEGDHAEPKKKAAWTDIPWDRITPEEAVQAYKWLIEGET